MIDTDENLQSRAETIKNETSQGANTATRVGSWMRDAWDSIINKLNDYVSTATFGAFQNNVTTELGNKASLDNNGKVPASQLPVLDLQKVTDGGNSTTHKIVVGGPSFFTTTINPSNLIVDSNDENSENRTIGVFLNGGMSFIKGSFGIYFRTNEYNNQTLILPNSSGTLVLNSDISNLQTQINAINTLLQSNDVNLDNLQELVNAIKDVQLNLATILVDDLTTGGVTKALTAQQGVVLKGLIDAIPVVPTTLQEIFGSNPTWYNDEGSSFNVSNPNGTTYISVSDTDIRLREFNEPEIVISYYGIKNDNIPNTLLFDFTIPTGSIVTNTWVEDRLANVQTLLASIESRVTSIESRVTAGGL